MTAKMDMTKAATTEFVAVEQGRTVAVHEVRGGGDSVVLMFHPAPGAGPFDPDPDVTASRGVTLVQIDRPGYGGSAPMGVDDWATVAAAADDAAAVLDRRGYRSVGVTGWSAGGRIALALAARRPDLVDRVAVVATPAPHEEVPWMPAEIAAAVDALRGLPAKDVHAAMTQQIQDFVSVVAENPEVGLEMLGRSDADGSVLERPGAAERFTDLLRAAFAQGASGLVSDMAGYTFRPWGFEPAEVGAETLLLYGSADPISGPEHGSWWHRQLPNARLEVARGAGHLLITPEWDRVLSHLVPAR
ncbi:MAG TPA: alpha/beta hydrolase [Jiangellaceae bacterium]